MTLVLITALPVVGALAAVPLGWAPRRAAASVATAASLLTFGAAAALAQAFAAGKDALVAEIGPWLPLRGAELALRLEASLLPLVLVIAGAVTLVLAASLLRPAAPATYFGVLILLGATNTILIGTNLVLVFVAWEVAALAGSVLIAGRRWTPAAADTASASLAAARLVDVAFLVAIVGILAVFRTVELRELAARVADQTLIPSAIDALRWCATLLAIVAIARGAQLPFSRWLGEAAIETDMPSRAVVRALLGAGGVLLLVRLAPILPVEATTGAGIVGATTAVFAIVVAIAQREGRRAVAWLAVASLGATFAGLLRSADLAILLVVIHVLTQTALAIASERGPALVRWRPLLSSETGRRAVLGLRRLGAAGSALLASAARPLAQGTERVLRGSASALGAGHMRLSALSAAAHTVSARRSLAMVAAGTLIVVAFWSIW